jgi:hypothetical protein
MNTSEMKLKITQQVDVPDLFSGVIQFETRLLRRTFSYFAQFLQPNARIIP